MDWMSEEVIVSTALHKEHEITAPGTTKIISVAELKAECDSVVQLGKLKTNESESLDAALSKEMGITTDHLKQIQGVCE